jgi:hypothetical protein
MTFQESRDSKLFAELLKKTSKEGQLPKRSQSMMVKSSTTKMSTNSQTSNAKVVELRNLQKVSEDEIALRIRSKVQ